MQTPLTSILVPVYQREGLITACVESALAQTWGDLEVVVVDNASTDGTWAVLQRLARADRRVRIFRNDVNIGPVRNWARCIAEARGTYGKLLFSDDLIAPTYVERLAPWLRDDSVAFVFSSVNVGTEPWSGPPWYHWRSREGAYPSKEFVRDALFDYSRLPSSPGVALFRMAELRSCLVERIPSPTFDDFAAHGAGPDLLLMLRAAERRARVAFVPVPLCFFRMHPGSITIANRELVRERYRQARIHFAAKHDEGTLLPAVLVREWMIARVFDRYPGGFHAHAARFVEQVPRVRVPLLVAEAARQVLDAVRPRSWWPKLRISAWLLRLRLERSRARA